MHTKCVKEDFGDLVFVFVNCELTRLLEVLRVFSCIKPVKLH